MQNIRTQWYDNSSLTDANLTCKLATLLALITVSRMSMIEHLNTEFATKDKENLYFISTSITNVGEKVRLPQFLPILPLVKIRHYVQWKYWMNILTIQNHEENLIMKSNCF